MALEDYRRVTISSDYANEPIDPIRLSAGDDNGRILRFVLKNGENNVSTTGLTCRFLIDQGAGLYQTLTPVAGTTTATWEAPLPMGGVSAGQHVGTIEVTDSSDNVVCSRNFSIIVETSILADGEQSEAMQDALRDFQAQTQEAIQAVDDALEQLIEDGIPDHSVSFAKLTSSVASGYVRSFETVAAMQAATDLAAGMICHTNGFHAAGDGGGGYYSILSSGTADGVHVFSCAGGLFAHQVLPYRTYGEMVMNDDSSKQWIADCAKSWINHASEIIYEGDFNLFFDNTQQVDGKWPLTCSIFAMAVVYGIDFEHSKYNGLTANVCNPNAYKDDELLEHLRNPNGFYSHQILPYLMAKGYAFKPAEDLSNVQTGDILFYESGSHPENWLGIDHSAIFAYHNNDHIHTVWEIGDDSGPHAQEYSYSYAATYCKWAVRLPFKQHETAPIDNIFITPTASMTQVQQVQVPIAKTIKPNTWYTFICKATNLSRDAVYPGLYANGFTTRLVTFNSGYVARPYNDVYIMPFYTDNVSVSDYVYPSFVARTDGTTGTTVGDFEWFSLVEGFYSDLESLSPYDENLSAQITALRTTVMGAENFADSISTTHTKSGGFGAFKNGRICNVSIDLQLTSNVSAYGVIATIPTGYRPLIQQHIGDFDITASGNVRSINAMSSGGYANVSFCYIAGTN